MKKVIAALIGSAACLNATTAWADDEAQKQATRLISQAISERVSRTVDLASSSAEGESTAGASKSVWALGSYTDLGIGGDKFADLYLVTGGYDSSHGDWVLGVSGSYAHIDPKSFGGFAVPGADSVTLSPYGAYKLSDRAFISALLNLSHSFSKGPDSTSGGGEIGLNAFTKAGNATLRGKVAYRGSFGIDPDSKLFSTLVGFGEAEFKLNPKAAFYVNSEANIGLNDDTDQVPIYVGTGLNFRPTDRSQFGIGYQRLLFGRGGAGGTGKIDVSTFLVQFRSVF